MSTDATDIRCAECGRDITHATSIYLVSGRYVCDICYVWLTAPRDCKHGHLARSCEICQLEADNAALRVLVEEHEELKAKLQARVAELEGAIQAKCLGCDAYWLCRTIDTPPDCPLYPYRGGE
jgi:NMD protein affecting ribosome stability and mRNA decay